MSTDREAQRLQDIIDNIARIESHVRGVDFARFSADQMAIDAV